MGNNITYSSEPGLDDLSYEVSLAVTVFQLILCIVGVVGNTLTIFAVILCKKLHRTYNIYVANLAVVDLIITGALIPTNIYGVFVEIPSNCDIIAVFSLTVLAASVMNMFMIALNRYILICRDTQTYTKWYNRKTVGASVIFIWIWSLILVLPMFSFGGLGWQVKTHYCFFVNYHFVTYLFVTFGLAQMGVVVPAIATAVCYMLILKKLRSVANKLVAKKETDDKRHPQQNKVKAQEKTRERDEANNQEVSTSEVSKISSSDYNTRTTGTIEEEISSNYESEEHSKENLPQTVKKKQVVPVSATQQQRHKAKAKAKASNRRLLGLVVIFSVFMVCWLPIALTFSIDYKQQLPAWVYTLIINIAWINSCINVFLYAVTNPTYRHVFKCIIKCKCKEINVL